MKTLNGMYIWHHVDNVNRIEGPVEGREYLVCIESLNPERSPWKMILAVWFNVGAEVNICESDGTPHHFKVDKDGFYIIDDFSDRKNPHIFRIRDVCYWTEISVPGTSPDEVLTIA